MSGLELTGLVLGMVGSVAGVVALAFTYRVTRIEEARRRDELRPSLRLTYDWESDASCLVIHNAGPVDLDMVEIEETSEHPKVMTGFVIAGVNRWSGEVGRIRVGDAAAVAIATRARGRGGSLVLRLRCRHGDLRWTLVERCEVPDERGSIVVSLDSVLERATESGLTDDPGRVAVIGVYDDLDRDDQELAVVDLETSGGLVIVGTFDSGKTTLLRTIALGLARQASPSVVQIYVFDFTGWSQNGIAELPHCSAVVHGNDVERVARAVTVLADEIARRQQILASARVESLSELRAQEKSIVFPRIVVLVDGYGQFRRTFDEISSYPWLTMFGDIVSRGRRVGVHCVLTATSTFDGPRRLDPTVSGRFVLRMEPGESLRSLGVATPFGARVDLSALPNGRGYLHGTTEVQVACVSTDPSGAAQDTAISAAAVRLAAADAARAPALPELPEDLVLDGSTAGRFTAHLGIADLTLAPVHVDLAHQNVVVLGPPASGRSSTLATIASGLRASSGSDLHLTVVGGPASPLASLDLWDSAAFTPAAHAELVAKLADMLDGASAGPRAVLFVDTAEELDGYDVLTSLDDLVRHQALRAAVACEPATLSAVYTGWLAALRRKRIALALQPTSTRDLAASIDVRARFRPGQTFPPGRGILVDQHSWSLVQVGRVLPRTSPGS